MQTHTIQLPSAALAYEIYGDGNVNTENLAEVFQWYKELPVYFK